MYRFDKSHRRDEPETNENGHLWGGGVNRVEGTGRSVGDTSEGFFILSFFFFLQF